MRNELTSLRILSVLFPLYLSSMSVFTLDSNSEQLTISLGPVATLAVIPSLPFWPPVTVLIDVGYWLECYGVINGVQRGLTSLRRSAVVGRLATPSSLSAWDTSSSAAQLVILFLGENPLANHQCCSPPHLQSLETMAVMLVPFVWPL